MNRSIKAFRYKDYAIFMDLHEDGGKITVGVEDGNILLFEGAGGLNGVCVPPSDFGGFRLDHQNSGAWNVVLEFTDGETHLLGRTSDMEAAKTWVSKAAELVSKHQAAVQTFVIQSIVSRASAKSRSKAKPRKTSAVLRKAVVAKRKLLVRVRDQKLAV